jgi:hypothetical protein
MKPEEVESFLKMCMTSCDLIHQRMTKFSEVAGMKELEDLKFAMKNFLKHVQKKKLANITDDVL